jgi:hypothetical protein
MLLQGRHATAVGLTDRQAPGAKLTISAAPALTIGADRPMFHFAGRVARESGVA